jgi:hypothetical protein
MSPDRDVSRDASRAADLQRWRARFPEAVPIDALPPRQVATCVGVVRAIRLMPGRALEVTIEDGHGEAVCLWTGRSHLPGVELGAGLRVTGTVGQQRGQPLLRNPDWALVGEPYA